MHLDQNLLQQVKSARSKKNKPIFVSHSKPSLGEIQAAEAKLCVTFPESYQHFVLELGIGDFDDTLRLFLLSDIYPFEMPETHFDGWIAFATDDLGNYLAFNPKEVAFENERKVMYLCHDPFGWGEVAATFSGFLEMLNGHDYDYQQLMDDLPSFCKAALPEALRPKTPWWKLW